MANETSNDKKIQEMRNIIGQLKEAIESNYKKTENYKEVLDEFLELFRDTRNKEKDFIDKMNKNIEKMGFKTPKKSICEKFWTTITSNEKSIASFLIWVLTTCILAIFSFKAFGMVEKPLNWQGMTFFMIPLVLFVIVQIIFWYILRKGGFDDY